jgi:hypothetical protein
LQERFEAQQRELSDAQSELSQAATNFKRRETAMRADLSESVQVAEMLMLDLERERTAAADAATAAQAQHDRCGVVCAHRQM